MCIHMYNDFDIVPFGSRDDEVAKNGWVDICERICMCIFVLRL
jgi:hypothetical protein